ncbi:outer membrane beta-barrel protein [Chryseolinea lacunae]|uniref:Outer membrane beta-barrel protein n=1 Tax=Chryseolinea lacunae TaxID=2801331 RepID=A0ABS1KUF5_9BACT|nr:outer membrane beta-barrel protein [Chryseolinea lacunae]MBL0743118.1 outer membrane beta-barrel protein [Chryseolinea lacunae]
MKKLLLLVVVLIPAFAHAQFNKGDAFLGGTISGSSDFSNNLSVSPFFGFFLNSKISLGGRVEYGSTRSEQNLTANDGSTSHLVTSTKSFFVAVVGRKYYPLSDKFFFALQGELNYGRSNVMNENNGVESHDDVYSLGLNVKPVFAYFPSPKWGIEGSVGSLGYTFSKALSGSSNHIASLDAGTVTLGFAYYFRK